MNMKSPLGAALTALSLAACTHGPVYTFQAKDTTEAVAAYQLCMILAGELHPWVIGPEDIAPRCAPKLQQVRLMALAENAAIGGPKLGAAVDEFTWQLRDEYLKIALQAP
jgi:hypothetical protein